MAAAQSHAGPRAKSGLCFAYQSFSADGRLTANAVESAELGLILEGIDLAGARRRPRWEPAKKSQEIRNSEGAPLV